MTLSSEREREKERGGVLFNYVIQCLPRTYVVGSKSFWPDIQKPRHMENAVRDIYSAIYGEVNVSVEKCVEIKGDYVEK